MPEYKNTNRFKKPFTKNGPGRRDFADSKERFRAECSSCHKACEVPFRPNGKKPVFCSNCFTPDTSRTTRDSYQKPEYPSPRAFAPTARPEQDRRIDDIKRQLAVLEGKIDLLIQSFEASKQAAKEVAPSLSSVLKKVSVKKVVARKKD